jgi:alpha-ketoglutarate-dependent taurine dioxygenase
MASLGSAEMASVARELDLFDGWVRVRLPTGHAADFHARWLRHNDNLDRHPQTGERTVDSSELPDNLAIRAVSLAGDTLTVQWHEESRISYFKLDWLAEHAYALDRALPPPPPSDVSSIEIDAASGDPSTYVQPVLACLRARGAAIVRRGPTGQPLEAQTQPIIDAFADAGLRVVDTHFGHVEDLRTDNTTNQNTDQLGYTDAAIDVHTDQPFLELPPRFQVLQSIRAADEGGDSSVVDAKAAAAHLASVDRRAWDLLTTVPVTFHRKQRGFEQVFVSPILVQTPERFHVRYSYFTMAPYRLAFEHMEEWYRAYDRFARLVRNPQHQFRFALRPGDLLIYDNHRMLHARAAFRGPRWVRGIYLDE